MEKMATNMEMPESAILEPQERKKAAKQAAAIKTKEAEDKKRKYK